jgi:hypothetical protein
MATLAGCELMVKGVTRRQEERRSGEGAWMCNELIGFKFETVPLGG